METISKPYGLFLKALDRRHVKQIGAKWLKDGRKQASFNSAYGGATSANGIIGEGQSVRRNVDAFMENAVN